MEVREVYNVPDGLPEGLVLDENKDTLIFLDVDGVVNHYGMRSMRVVKAGYYNIWLPEFMEAMIQDLVKHHQVVWCTAWKERANEFIAPILGIEPLFVMTDGYDHGGVAWKEHHVRPVAVEALKAGKRVVWLEDFHTVPVIPGVELVDTTPAGGLFPWHIPSLLSDEFTFSKDKPEPKELENPFDYVEWMERKGAGNAIVRTFNILNFKGEAVNTHDRWYGFLTDPMGQVYETPVFETFEEVAEHLADEAYMSWHMEQQPWYQDDFSKILSEST